MSRDTFFSVDVADRPRFPEHFVVSELENMDWPGVQTLRQVIAEYGSSGSVTSPLTGRQAQFSLDHWADRDPDTTYLLVGFSYVDPAKVGTTLSVEKRSSVIRMPKPKARLEFEFE